MSEAKVTVHFDDVDFEKLKSDEDFQNEADRLLPNVMPAFGKAVAEFSWKKLQDTFGGNESQKAAFIESVTNNYVNDPQQRESVRAHVIERLKEETRSRRGS